jgi:hypothetical protein
MKWKSNISREKGHSMIEVAPIRDVKKISDLLPR